MPDIVNGVGPKPAAGMIIGEAPGGEEERLGEPFVGMSGKLLNEAIERAGASRKDFYITNCYKFRPPNNRTPTADEFNEHEPLLAEEFEEVNPKAVLLLGGFALEMLAGEVGITKHRGTWLDYFSFAVMPTWHPSYVLRMGGRDTFTGSQFFDDVKTFVEAAKAS